MLSKEKVLPEPIKGLKENPFLDSYVIEFLDLPSNFKEPDLRKGLIRNMKDFILEVGRDFTFIDEDSESRLVVKIIRLICCSFIGDYSVLWRLN